MLFEDDDRSQPTIATKGYKGYRSTYTVFNDVSAYGANGPVKKAHDDRDGRVYAIIFVDSNDSPYRRY